ncbi:SET domain-containing protein [Thozetella sp. PMI_491]|nr:SET domain-containing protein [Thozetella sp. PMI_491]
MCGYDSFLVRQFGDKSQCSPYLSSQPSLGTADGDRIEQSASNSSIWIDNTLRDVPSGYSWTFSSPCIKSRLSTEEICVFSDSTFAQGRGISLLTTAARAEFISSRPPFVNPDLTPEEVSVSYKMKEFPGKGLGLEATRQIKQGQSIMVNTPSLMIDYRSFEWLTTEEHRRLQAVAIGYLPDAHQEAVMRLSTHDDVTDMDKDEIIGKITSTNSFDIAPEKEDPEQDYKFFVTFPEISRLNHDCRPNADYRFDYTTMTHSVHALRDILPGEELSLSYTNPLAPRQERLQRLKHLWGFQCGCDSCTQNEILGAASDERVSQINSLIPEFTKDRASSRASPEMAELLINLYKQEDVWGSLYMAYTYAALEYNGIGEPQIAGKYARLALQYGLPSLGNKDNYMVEMTRLADDPRQHWSWLLRSKGNTDLEREHEHH